MTSDDVTAQAEDGSELFRHEHGASRSWALSFGPVDEGGVRWSLYALRSGLLEQRHVLGLPRPRRSQLHGWLTDCVGAQMATELLSFIGRLRDFYAAYFAARPDLDHGDLTAVA